VAAYAFIGGVPEIQSFGTDITREAQRNTYVALASSVVFSLVFGPWPSAIWTDEAIRGQASLWAGYWDQNAAVPGVTAIDVTQETDDLGNLHDIARVAIVSTSGLTRSITTVPAKEWLPSVEGTTLSVSFGDAVRAAIAQLDASEAPGE
jgi:hypothetical protein